MKYGFTDEEPRRRIVTLIGVIISELIRVEGRNGITVGWDVYESSGVGHLGELDEALCGSLRVDGTVLMTDSLEVLGFGVEIAG